MCSCQLIKESQLNNEIPSHYVPNHIRKRKGPIYPSSPHILYANSRSNPDAHSQTLHSDPSSLTQTQHRQTRFSKIWSSYWLFCSFSLSSLPSRKLNQSFHSPNLRVPSSFRTPRYGNFLYSLWKSEEESGEKERGVHTVWKLPCILYKSCWLLA